ISDIEDIDTIGAMSASGGGAMMGMGGGKNSMSYYILLDEDKKQTTTEIATDIQKKIKDLDCTMDIQTSNMDMSMLGGSGIEIVIKGKDLNKMQNIADELADKMKDVEGIAKITSANNDAPTEMHIAVNKQLAAQKGLTVAQVYAQVSAALKQNSTATTLSTDTDDYPVIIVNSISKDLSRVNLKDYEITLPDNAQKGMPADDEKDEDKKDSILLSDLATITEESGRTAIDHENQVRMMSVKMEIDEEHNIGLVGREVTKIMDNYQAPEGYNVEMKGENETINEAIYNIILMISLAVVFIYMIMVAQFQSLLSPFIVMFTMPLAFTGGLLALQITGKDLSML
ncbi:MAG: efflux RND transporter permease subunit, partial [Oscillospiraceae bacterium]